MRRCDESGNFPPSVWQAAHDHANLQLIDGAGIADLMFSLYDQLDLQQRQMVPLKRIFVPELAVGDTGD